MLFFVSQCLLCSLVLCVFSVSAGAILYCLVCVRVFQCSYSVLLVIFSVYQC